MRKEMTVADKLQRTFNNLPQEKKDRINKILENYEEAIFATPHEPRNEEKLVQEITTLREQVEKLTKERDALLNAIDNEMVVTHMGVFNLGDDPKVALNKICCYAQDLGKFFAEDACKEQLAALAAQNEKMRSAVRWIQDRCAGDAMPRWEPGMRTTHSRGLILDRTNYVLDLPDLASPVLNRIRAEGMRMAAEILIDPMDRAAAQKICAQADELEKQNG